MTAGWIASVAGGAVFAAVNVTAAWAVAALWPSISRRLAGAGPAVRARHILLCRLTPAALAAAVTVVALVAFFLHEPPDASEQVGIALRAAAALGIGFAVTTVVRVGVLLAASARLANRWTRDAAVATVGGSLAWVVDTAFPIVAVVGLRRPRLVVARSVVERCSPREMAAIVAHERGHLAAADNLKRLIAWGLVDALALSPRSRQMAVAWQEAAEQAADDHATGQGADPLDLARALVAVARLAPPRVMASLPASAFYRGDGIERRVRRLLDTDRAVRGEPRRNGRRLLAAGLACAAPLAVDAGRPVYLIVEWLVTHLP